MCKRIDRGNKTRLEPTAMGYRESESNDSDDRGDDKRKKPSRRSGVELEAVKVSVGVVFLDKLDDVVSGGSKRDVVGHAHAGMQDGDELALGIEDGCARVALAGKVTVLLAEIEDRDLPGFVPELVTRIGLKLREATKGKVGRLPILGNDETSVAMFVHEVRIGQACGVDKTRQPEEMVVRVREGRRVGAIGVEERRDLVVGVLAG